MKTKNTLKERNNKVTQHKKWDKKKTSRLKKRTGRIKTKRKTNFKQVFYF